MLKMGNKYFMFLILILISCNEKKVELFAPNQLKKIIKNNNLPYYYYDVIFINNPPNDKVNLIFLINEYNKKTINHDTVEIKYKYLQRAFYRISSKTPQNFIDDEGGFITDKLEDHTYDLLGIYEMNQCFNNSNINNKDFEWTLICGSVKFNTIYFKQCN